MRIRYSERGMTLIEIMVALAIIAIVSVSAIVGLGAIKRGKLRSSANKLAGTIRYAHNRAITTNSYYRLKMDLDKNTYQLEVSEHAPRLRKGQTAEEVASTEPLTNSPSAPEDDVSSASPKASFETVSDTSTRPVEIPPEIELKAAFTSRTKDVKRNGKVYLYFFPDGHTEQGFICIGRRDESDSEYLLKIGPLTGRVVLEAGCQNMPTP